MTVSIKLILFLATALIAGQPLAFAAGEPNPFAPPAKAAAPAVPPTTAQPALPPPIPEGPAPSKKGQEPILEEISVQRIGKVNDLHIFRGSETYLFESAKNHKLSRRPSNTFAINSEDYHMPSPPAAGYPVVAPRGAVVPPPPPVR